MTEQLRCAVCGLHHNHYLSCARFAKVIRSPEAEEYPDDYERVLDQLSDARFIGVPGADSAYTYWADLSADEALGDQAAFVRAYIRAIEEL